MLYLIVFLAFTGLAFLFPTAPSLMLELPGGGEAAFGYALGVYGAATAVASPLWGKLQDRGLRRWPILIGIAGFSGLTAGLLLVESMLHAYLLMGAGGLLASALMPTVVKFSSEYDERSTAMPLIGAAITGALVVGSFAGGQLGDRFSLELTFAMGGTLVLLGAVPYLLYAPERSADNGEPQPSDESGTGDTFDHEPASFESEDDVDYGSTESPFAPEQDNEESSPSGDSSEDKLRDPGGWLSASEAFLYAATLGIIEASLAVYLFQHFGLGESAAGTALSVFALAGFASQGGVLRSMLRRLTVGFSLALAGFGGAIGLYLFTQSSAPWQLYAAIGVAGFFGLLIRPTLYFRATGDDESSGNRVGKVESGNALGRVVGPIAGGVLVATSLFTGGESGASPAPFYLGALLYFLIALIEMTAMTLGSAER